MKCLIFFKKNAVFYDFLNPFFFESTIFQKNEIGLFDINFENKYVLSLKYKDSFECIFDYYYRNANNTQIFFSIISIFLGSCEIISNNDNILNELANEYELKYGKLNYEGTNISSYFKDKLSVW